MREAGPGIQVQIPLVDRVASRVGREPGMHHGRDGDVMSSFERDDVPLIVAMAEQCRDLIEAWDRPALDQPASLQLKHLEWMCNQVAEQTGAWPETKLHRWIGFIQAGMIANRLLRLDGAKRMFDAAKNAHPGLDQDLLDHLDPDDCFELDIGGQG